MFKSLSSFVYSFVVHKFSSSIWTAYVFAWVVCNWKSIAYFMLSKDEIGIRMGVIDLVYSGENWEVWGYPLIPAAIFLFFFPWLEANYKKFISKDKKALSEVFAEEQKKYYEDMYDVAKIKGKVLRAEAENKEVDELTQELRRSEQLILDYEEQLKSYRELSFLNDHLIGNMKVELKELTKENYDFKKDNLLEGLKQLDNNNRSTSFNYSRSSGGFSLGKGGRNVAQPPPAINANS